MVEELLLLLLIGRERRLRFVQRGLRSLSLLVERRVQAGVTNLTTQSAGRQAALQRALDEQRKRVIELRDARAQAFVLQRDVDTAQKAYEAALQRYLVNKVESGARAANVSILNPATEPTHPSRPKVLVNIVLGIIVGLVLGLGAVLAVLIAWFAILVTGRYPRGLFDYVLGVGRWALRVQAYAFHLLTDTYPPFSLR